MKNRLYLVLGALLLAALGWATWQALRQPPEPVHDGKPLSFLLTNYTPAAYRRLEADSNAIPFLIEALKRDRWFGAAYYRKSVWPKLPAAIREHLPPPPADNQLRRANAVAVLGRMGPMAEPAIPTLIRTLKEVDESSIRAYAAIALGSLGKGNSNVIPALTEAVKEDKDFDVRMHAVAALGYVGGGQAATVPLTEAALKDKDPEIRRNSIKLLLTLDSGAAAKAGIIPRLISDLGSGDRIASDFADISLVELGKVDGGVVEALTRALGDMDLSVRKAATNVLMRIDPEAAAKAGVNSPFVLHQ
jgi:HEAT repeat protein